MAFSYSKFGLAFIVVHFIKFETIVFVSKISRDFVKKNSYKIV